jgi:hypothetical protein
VTRKTLAAQYRRAVLAALKQGMEPEAAARYCRVPLRRVLDIYAAAEQRARFAQEHANCGGAARIRTLGADNPCR